MLVEVGVLSIVLAASSQRCGTEDSVFSAQSSPPKYILTVSGSKEPKLLYSQSLENALAADLELVKEIQYVSVERADENLLVWIAVDNPTKEVRERVFQKQFELIDGFPEVSFDFNLVNARNVTAQDFASSAKLIYQRES